MYFHKLFVVSSLHNIELNDPLCFRYCDDNENPRFPNTLLFLTMNYNKGETVGDEWVESRFRSAWSDNNDEITPLLSRIANQVLHLKTSDNVFCSV